MDIEIQFLGQINKDRNSYVGIIYIADVQYNG